MRVAPDLAEALAAADRAEITAESLALHIQAVIQGAFIRAKATGDPAVAEETIDHLSRYLTLLFNIEETRP